MMEARAQAESALEQMNSDKAQFRRDFKKRQEI